MRVWHFTEACDLIASLCAQIDQFAAKIHSRNRERYQR